MAKFNIKYLIVLAKTLQDYCISKCIEEDYVLKPMAYAFLYIITWGKADYNLFSDLWDYFVKAPLTAWNAKRLNQKGTLHYHFLLIKGDKGYHYFSRFFKN